MDHTTLDTPTPTIHDRLGRPLRSLRLSVTDRCNLRCKYCMPEDDYAWLPRETLLRRCLVTPSCGLGSLGVEQAEAILRLTLAISERLRRGLPG